MQHGAQLIAGSTVQLSTKQSLINVA